MKKFISIFTGKIFIFLGKLLNRGSAIPGKAAYILNKNILSDFILPQKIIAVTGSSGKGSTSKIIAEVYKNLGYKVAYNSKGSNDFEVNFFKTSFNPFVINFYPCFKFS